MVMPIMLIITKTMMKWKFLIELTLFCQVIVAANPIAKLPVQQFQEHDSQRNKQRERIWLQPGSQSLSSTTLTSSMQWNLTPAFPYLLSQDGWKSNVDTNRGQWLDRVGFSRLPGSEMLNSMWTWQGLVSGRPDLNRTAPQFQCRSGYLLTFCLVAWISCMLYLFWCVPTTVFTCAWLTLHSQLLLYPHRSQST